MSRIQEERITIKQDLCCVFKNKILYNLSSSEHQSHDSDNIKTTDSWSEYKVYEPSVLEVHVLEAGEIGKHKNLDLGQTARWLSQRISKTLDISGTLWSVPTKSI